MGRVLECASRLGTVPCRDEVSEAVSRARLVPSDPKWDAGMAGMITIVEVTDTVSISCARAAIETRSRGAVWMRNTGAALLWSRSCKGAVLKATSCAGGNAQGPVYREFAPSVTV